MAHKKHKKKYLSILLIPDDESSPRSLRIRFSVITASLLAAVFILVSIVIGAVTYGTLVQKAYENISLKQQNEQLIQQLQKVNELSSNLEDLKNYGRKVRNSLIGYINLQGDIENLSTGTTRESATNQSLFSVFSSIPLRAPVTGFVSQEYNENLHNGVDIVAPEGTPIVAAGSGTVLFTGWTIDGGNTIVIGHKGGFYSYYKHNLRNVVYESQMVDQGEVIGYLGNSGQKSFGPHLHFEVWKDGIPINPKILVLDLNK